MVKNTRSSNADELKELITHRNRVELLQGKIKTRFYNFKFQIKDFRHFSKCLKIMVSIFPYLREKSFAKSEICHRTLIKMF